MSGGLEALKLKDDDVSKMLIAGSHLGAENVNFQMKQYVHKRRSDGINIINIKRTWEKLLLAARAICAIEHPSEVFVISSRPAGQRAVLKFAHYTGATPIAGRFTPGAFTNQIQAAFREPRLLIVTDPAGDHQPITESSYVNIPVIAFVNTDSSLRYIDIGIPCNNKGAISVGLMWWLLCREVLRLRGTIPRETKWSVVVDLFFYRDPEEAEKEEQAAKESAPAVKDTFAPAIDSAPITTEWADAADTNVQVSEVWADEPVVAPTGPAAAAPAAVPPVAAVPFPASNEWGAAPVQDEWTKAAPAEVSAQAASWGGGSSSWS